MLIFTSKKTKFFLSSASSAKTPAISSGVYKINMVNNLNNNKLPFDFKSPTALPHTPEEAKRWQEANRGWWEEHPMRYDWKEKVHFEEFSKEFYQEIDARFFYNLRNFMPWQKIPFEILVDFDTLKKQDVLEIGVGNGIHAQLLSSYTKSFTGIDITDYAVKSTLERVKIFGLSAKILKMDAEQMDFPDNSFDFVWVWGVIHHSANPKKIIKEIYRVLKPGGKAVTMVYHRGFWNYYILGGLFQGLLKGDILRYRSLHKVIQANTDGALARYYSPGEWKSLVSEFFNVKDIKIFGGKSEIIPLPAGKIKRVVLKLLPDKISSFLTNKLKMGSFLVSILESKKNKASL